MELIINKHENVSVHVYWNGVGLPGDSCRVDQTQGQKSLLKIMKSTVELRSVWHYINVATEREGQMRAVVCYSMRLRNSHRERARDIRRDAHILP